MAKNDSEDLVLNPTLSVFLTYRMVTLEGELDLDYVPMKESGKLVPILLHLARLIETGHPLDRSLEAGIIEDLRTRQVLITREECKKLLPIKEWQQLRSDDILVASYPKSGTTWLQMVVYQLVSNGSLDFRHLHDIYAHIHESGTVTRKLREQIAMSPRRRLLATHNKPDECPQSSKTIYVYRNPVDVAVSYYHHLTATREFRGTLDQFVEAFVEGEIVWGSWFDHFEQWWALRENSRVLFVAYETISKEFENSVHSIASFCGVKVDPQRLPTIKEVCSFDFMKRIAHKLDPRTANRDSSRFFRKGQVGTGLSELSAEKVRLIESKASALAKKLDPSHSAAGMPSWWHALIEK